MKIRIKFEKKGPLKFIGHLDTMRYFQRAIRRAGIDIAYTEGFSPHPIMSFALPLGVGVESEGEYFDIQAHSSLSSKEAIEALNQQMSDGIIITGYRKLPDESKKAMALVEAADYIVRIRNGYEPDVCWEESLMKFYAQQKILIVKQTKKSERELDLKPLIFELKCHEAEENRAEIYMRLKAGSVDNIKPQLVMAAFYQFMGLKLPDFALEIMRLDLFALSNADANSCLHETHQEEQEIINQNFDNINQQFISLGMFGEIL